MAVCEGEGFGGQPHPKEQKNKKFKKKREKRKKSKIEGPYYPNNGAPPKLCLTYGPANDRW